MGTARCSGIAFAALLAALISNEAAGAECGNNAIDACLIGAWQQTGGGAAEWMRENMKMAQVKMSASNAVITLNRDGTLSTSQVDTKAEVAAKNAEMQASAQMTSQGSGQWSAAEGKLTLCMDAVASTGSAQLKLPNGMTLAMPMQQAKPSVSTMSYTCSGDTLSTVQPMPNNTTMTTTYSRVR
jgi:hypothetical protein